MALHKMIHGEDGIVFAWGDTVPTDGTQHYAPGCTFVHTDGDATNHRYQNDGTASSCDFNKMLTLDAAAGADSASGLLFGKGTTADPATTSTASAKFIELRCQSTATSGDNRLLYMRYALAGGGGGECLRALTRIDSNVGTAHGAHLSLSFVATAGGSECSGLGVAARGTLHIPNIASWAPTGTYAAGMFEIYSDGANSDPAGMTELSVLRLCNSGNATGKADVDTDAVLLSIQGFTAAADTTKVVSSVSLAELPAGTIGLRVDYNGAKYRMPLVVESAWD